MNCEIKIRRKKIAVFAIFRSYNASKFNSNSRLTTHDTFAVPESVRRGCLHHWIRGATNLSCRGHHKRREREWIKEVIIRDVIRLVSTLDPSRVEFESQQVGQRRPPLLFSLSLSFSLSSCSNYDEDARMEEMQFCCCNCIRLAAGFSRWGGEAKIATSRTLWPVNHRGTLVPIRSYAPLKTKYLTDTLAAIIPTSSRKLNKPFLIINLRTQRELMRPVLEEDDRETVRCALHFLFREVRALDIIRNVY